jgi:hypothetical protein
VGPIAKEIGAFSNENGIENKGIWDMAINLA